MRSLKKGKTIKLIEKILDKVPTPLDAKRLPDLDLLIKIRRTRNLERGYGNLSKALT